MSTTQPDPSATEVTQHTAATEDRRRDRSTASSRPGTPATDKAFGGALHLGRDLRDHPRRAPPRPRRHRRADTRRSSRSIYAGSTNRMELVDARHVADDVIVATSRNTLDAPSGPLAGIHAATSTSVLVRVGDTWQVAVTHNTLEATR